MKVRIGITLGQLLDTDRKPEEILDFVDHLEALDVDSLWVSDRLVSSALSLEPITFLSYIAGRLPRMVDRRAGQSADQRAISDLRVHVVRHRLAQRENRVFMVVRA